MKESEIYAELKRDLKDMFWLRRIEDALSAGMLDTLISRDNVTLYVELKPSPNFDLDGGKLRFIKERVKAGCIHDMFFICKNDQAYCIASAVDILQAPNSPESWTWLYTNRDNIGGVFLTMIFNIKESNHDRSNARPSGVRH